MRKIIAGALLALTVAACGSSHAATPPSPVKPGDGGNFLPTYVHDLTEPHPDNACHPQTLADLLAPCDQGSRP
jgi:hypothetical protein